MSGKMTWQEVFKLPTSSFYRIAIENEDSYGGEDDDCNKNQEEVAHVLECLKDQSCVEWCHIQSPEVLEQFYLKDDHDISGHVTQILQIKPAKLHWQLDQQKEWEL